MVDDFTVCVDRLIASAAYSDSSSDNNRGRERGECDDDDDDDGRQSINHKTKKIVKESKSGTAVSVKNNRSKEMAECRICQEEDEVHAMEAPCACNGSLKFAHRKCIQRWCDKKGDITCEICTQVFSPNYSIPPTKISPDVFTIDIRQAWGAQMNLRDSHLLLLSASERQLLQSEYEEAVAHTCSIICLRSVALILLMVLLIHQALMVTRDSGMVQDFLLNYNVSVLQFIGFLLPCCVMARSFYIQSRRRRQG